MSGAHKGRHNLMLSLSTGMETHGAHHRTSDCRELQAA